MKTLSFLTLRTASILLLLASALPATNAADLTATKFFGKWTDPDPETYGTDLVIAASEKWIVAGFYKASEQAAKQGALQVFNAVTGAWVRKVLPPTGRPPTCISAEQPSDQWRPRGGHASGIGRAYIINLPTGKILRTLIPTDPDPECHGRRGGISGNRVIIGSPTYSSLQGAAYIFDLNTGLQLAKLTASGGAPDDLFGSSVAAEGNVAVITAPYVNAARGTGYLFDLTTFAQISKLQPSASLAGDHVGESVAIHQGKVVLGAPDADAGKGKIFVINLNDGSQRTLSLSDAVAPDRLGLTICLQHGLLIAGCPNKNDFGKVYAFDLNSGESTEFDQIEPPDSDSSVFGLHVALCGNTVYASTVLDGTQAENAGAFWRFRYITKPMPLTKVTAKGDSANGAVNINYKSFSSAFINSSSECMISGRPRGIRLECEQRCRHLVNTRLHQESRSGRENPRPDRPGHHFLGE